MRDLVIRGGTVIDGTGRDKADVNVIDVDGLAVARPELVYDLPGGGKADPAGARVPAHPPVRCRGAVR